jgi:hypothetical protein
MPLKEREIKMNLWFARLVCLAWALFEVNLVVILLWSVEKLPK